MFLVILVVDNPDCTSHVLDAWATVGVTGATILESTGMGRLRGLGIRDDLPLMPSLGRVLSRQEDRHRTLFAAIRREEQIDQVVEATEAVIGDLDRDNTGVLFVLPVLRAYGLGNQPRN